MKRLLCGSVVLAASLGLVSCNSDPTSDFRNGPSRILAEPSELFITQGDVEPVVVKVIDEAGDPLAATWEAEPGTGISVERNPDFLPTTAGAPLESEVQFIVTAGGAPGATAFTVSAGELSLEIPVRIMPTSLAATFSNAAPAGNEPVTITAEGYTFLPEAAVSFGGDTAITLANDGASLTFLPSPGTTGPALVESIAINFLPETPLSLQTDTEITVGAVAPMAGTGSTATAPAIAVPGEGETTAFWDAGVFTAPDITGDGGLGAQYYQFVVTEAASYRFVTNWAGGADIDAIVCFDPDCVGGAFAGTGIDHPEDGTLDLTPGTYFFVSVLFAGAPEPFSVTISR